MADHNFTYNWISRSPWLHLYPSKKHKIYCVVDSDLKLSVKYSSSETEDIADREDRMPQHVFSYDNAEEAISHLDRLMTDDFYQYLYSKKLLSFEDQIKFRNGSYYWSDTNVVERNQLDRALTEQARQSIDSNNLDRRKIARAFLGYHEFLVASPLNLDKAMKIFRPINIQINEEVAEIARKATQRLTKQAIDEHLREFNKTYYTVARRFGS